MIINKYNIMSKEKIYQYKIELREADVEGMFIAPESEVEKLKGVKINFGEVCKHCHLKTEIYPYLEVYSDDPEKVQKMKDVMGTSVSGLDPFEMYHTECDSDCPSDCDGENN